MVATAGAAGDRPRDGVRPGLAQLTARHGLLVGADYNPEQWPRETWPEDARLMREAGLNLATVGVFSWAELEPTPDARRWGWLDEVVDLLHAEGVAVDLATPTASPPPWLGLRWPETLAVDPDGVRMSHGSRNHFCPSSPVYRERSLALVADLVERYADHPAVQLWHVGNEFGQVCHCDLCGAAFARWLEDRYGDLDTLNAAWGTAFWSQRLAGWDEVLPPRRAPYLGNPTRDLDFRRFASDALLALYREQRDLITARVPATPVTTNFMGFFPLADYRRWAPEVDVVADDSYPDPEDPASPAETALTHDLMRSLGGGRGWMLLEQASGAVSWREHNVAKSAARMRRDSLQAVAHGADGSCWFQWRASRAGSERFHAALVPHAGPDTAAHRAVRAHGAELARLRGVAGAPTRADVALLFDWDSWWAAEAPALPSARLRPLDQLRAWHRPLWERGVAVDVRGSGDDLTGYRLVLAPSAFLLDDDARDRLVRYVASGGTLVLGPFSAVVDASAHVRTGPFPVGLTEVLGVAGEEWLPLADADPVALAGEVAGPTGLWAERLHAADAEVLGRFAGGPVDGGPAVLRHGHGAGRAWYVGTVPAPEVLDDLAGRWLADAGVDGALTGLSDDPLPPGVEVTRRGDHWFLLNHTDHDVRLGLTAPVRDLLTTTHHTHHLDLRAGDVVVLDKE
ncbi:beta-galactosidase [Microlunatus capsulatus]|uniref:Beta-galactosidase n=1 Tax=Microlunatus capsulatus TaxID=99117 RepID=A0ABS4ZAF7_9ACTN|nr:beta-galactosidase [Microlunatus capsulatus]MBP2418038.1 beta-galactosidase [Microlunatus capsulatus]